MKKNKIFKKKVVEVVKEAPKVVEEVVIAPEVERPPIGAGDGLNQYQVK